MTAAHGSPAHHETLINAFRSIRDKNALGWIVLDYKSELFLTAAIATEINRQAQKRLAHIEFTPRVRRKSEPADPTLQDEARIDLVVLSEPLVRRDAKHLDRDGQRVKMRYEAKAGQCFDFAPSQKTPLKYLGAALDADMAGMTPERGAGLFFISEATHPNRHLKYFKGHTTNIDAAVALLCKNVTRGTLVARDKIACETADETDVTIHMCIFDPV